MNETEKDFILSDATDINSHGFKINLTGGRFERFDKNPVMLYDHDSNRLIGRWENRRIEGDTMPARPVFDLADPFAAEQARKVKEGFLRGASIGIRIIKLDYIGGEYIATEWELIEASITPIPSDANAIRLYNEKRETLTFEQVKLSLINTNTQHKHKLSNMDENKINLSAATVKSLGLSGDYSERDVEIKVAEKDKEIETLKADLKTEQDAKIEAYLSAALDAGKITPKQKEAYTELARTNFEQVKSIVEAIDAKPKQSLKDLNPKTDLSAGRETWGYMDWAKKDPTGLQNLKLNNPAEFERLQETINR